MATRVVPWDYGAARAFRKSEQFAIYIDRFDAARQAYAQEQLDWECEIETLQERRDKLNARLPTPILALSWEMVENPEAYLRAEISTISAALESLENSDVAQSAIERRSKTMRDRQEGFRRFLKSGLTTDGFSKVASVEHFYNSTTGERLSHRQIHRIVRDMKASTSE